jgi:hypothetical protein
MAPRSFALACHTAAKTDETVAPTEYCRRHDIYLIAVIRQIRQHLGELFHKSAGSGRGIGSLATAILISILPKYGGGK